MTRRGDGRKVQPYVLVLLVLAELTAALYYTMKSPSGPNVIDGAEGDGRRTVRFGASCCCCFERAAAFVALAARALASPSPSPRSMAICRRVSE